MIGALIYLAGIGTGVLLAGAIYGFALPRVRSSLPPATPRAIARERRRNLADLRSVMQGGGGTTCCEPEPLHSFDDFDAEVTRP